MTVSLIVNFEDIAHFVLVFLLWTLSLHLFAVCNLFYISSFLDFMVSSIFGKDFHEVEYFHEVECTGGANLKQWNGKCISIKFL